MLINCPRCGFSQPKDQYCANCGVNMDKYTPQKRTLIEKIISNTVVQVVLVVGLTLTVSYFALKSNSDYPQQTSRRKQVMSTMSTSNQSSAAAHQAAHGNPNGVTNSTSEGDTPVQLEVKSEEQKNQFVGLENEESADSSATSAQAATNKLSSITLKYSFYEIDGELFKYWLQINNLSDSDMGGGHQVGLLNTDILHKHVPQQPLKTETKKVGLINKESFNAGVNSEGSDGFLGLTSEIKLNQIKENQLQGTLTIERKNNQDSDSINVNMTIPQKNVFFIHWENALTGLERDPAILSKPPFQVLNSPRYKNRSSVFVIIIEPFF